MTRPFTSVGNMIDDKEYVCGIQLSHAFFFVWLVTEGSIITKTSLLDKLQQKIVIQLLPFPWVFLPLVTVFRNLLVHFDHCKDLVPSIGYNDSMGRDGGIYCCKNS